MIEENQAGSIVGVIKPTSLSDLTRTGADDYLNQLLDMIQTANTYVVAIGSEYGYARSMTARYLHEKAGLEAISLIHATAYVDRTARFGTGIHVMPRALVHKFSSIGNDCILNSSCTVDHECTIGNGVHIMGSAAIAGRVTIDNYVTVGTNATILPDSRLGENSIIGAGSVVLKDVLENDIVAGVPAKKIKNAIPKTFLDDAFLKIWGQLGHTS